MARADGQDAFVTIAVLAICGLFAAIAAGLIMAPRPTLGRAAMSMTAFELDLLLDSGLELAAFRIYGAGLDPDVTAFAEETVRLASGSATVLIEAEAGRIDLNTSDPALLEGLFRLVATGSMPPALFAEKVVALRQQDSSGDGRGFVSVGEIAGLADLSERDFARVAPFLTVWNRSGLIDVWSAAPTVLMSLPGMTEREAGKLIALRGKGRRASEEAVSAIVARYGTYATAERQDRYRITIEAQARGQVRRAQAIVDTARGERPFMVNAWARKPPPPAGRDGR